MNRTEAFREAGAAGQDEHGLSAWRHYVDLLNEAAELQKLVWEPGDAQLRAPGFNNYDRADLETDVQRLSRLCIGYLKKYAEPHTNQAHGAAPTMVIKLEIKTTALRSVR